MDLFSMIPATEKTIPLAARMRPRNFDEFLGQEAVVGKGKFLRRMVESDNVPSLVLFGPPGTGKTTLAEIISQQTGASFEKLNAVSAGVSDIRKAVEQAKEKLSYYRQRTILFVDEFHRFNKGQQDALLPHVENGTVILIGATTENPFFEINSPLLSRMRIVRLASLSGEAIGKMLENALKDRERGLGDLQLNWTEEVVALIIRISGGDGRVALNLLEQAAYMLQPGGLITPEIIYEVTGERIQVYDKQGDQHYDVISAFIKSMRGSDPDAALHYLARMLGAGEDIKFIARRVVICASEDVGNADPTALVVAMTAAQAVQFVGMPEAQIILGQAVTYIAAAPKSNAAYKGIKAAMEDIKNMNCGNVPIHLRDSGYKGATVLGNGSGYLYPHDYPEGYVKQQYLPDALKETTYYSPTEHGREKEMKARQKMRKDME